MQVGQTFGQFSCLLLFRILGFPFLLVFVFKAVQGEVEGTGRLERYAWWWVRRLLLFHFLLDGLSAKGAYAFILLVAVR